VLIKKIRARTSNQKKGQPKDRHFFLFQHKTLPFRLYSSRIPNDHNKKDQLKSQIKKKLKKIINRKNFPQGIFFPSEL
jgi:hypothetical protein